MTSGVSSSFYSLSIRCRNSKAIEVKGHKTVNIAVPKIWVHETAWLALMLSQVKDEK